MAPPSITSSKVCSIEQTYQKEFFAGVISRGAVKGELHRL
jgi:hypothetical protein